MNLLTSEFFTDEDDTASETLTKFTICMPDNHDVSGEQRSEKSTEHKHRQTKFTLDECFLQNIHNRKCVTDILTSTGMSN